MRTGAAALTLLLAGSAQAQLATNVPPPVPNAKPVTLRWVKVHSTALEGNLEGDSADRDVLVVLPPSYASGPKRRYPVVYALHGYSIGAAQWIKEIHVPQTIESAFGRGAAEMIFVFPDSKTAHNGSMYSSSVTTGDFETFVSRDLVRYVDDHFRTLPQRESRGLAGHSMGGYGTARIGMRHPDVFGALYIMSPCCLSPRGRDDFNATDEAALEKVKSVEEATQLPWASRAQLASAAAWSPNPKNPPLYLDLPVKGGAVQADVLAKWTANAPLAFIDQYVGNLRSYHAITIDVGDEDGLKTDTQKLHEALDRYGIRHSFEIYRGTHTSNVAFRFQDHLIPFLGRTLQFAGTH
jgi:enterochelin esterase-like enzyme